MIDVMTTEAKLVAMLTENTGRHLLDSGGAYGRAWERNQGRDLASFQAAPSLLVDEYGAALDLFHWLRERVQYDAELDAVWQAFDEANPDGYWHDLGEQFADEHGQRDDYWSGFGWVNTYNSDNYLNGTIQFLPFTMNNSYYVLLQIHGGADVRGGYTRPAVFATDEQLFDFTRLDVHCSGQDCDFRAQLADGRVEDCSADLPDSWEVQHGCPQCQAVMTA